MQQNSAKLIIIFNINSKYSGSRIIQITLEITCTGVLTAENSTSGLRTCQGCQCYVRVNGGNSTLANTPEKTRDSTSVALFTVASAANNNFGSSFSRYRICGVP